MKVFVFKDGLMTMKMAEKKSLTKFAHKELKAIHNYSRQYNKLIGEDHSRALLKLVQEHAAEITELYRRKDKHYLIETGDLLILCLEIIKESGSSADAILTKCYE